eukprot:comp11719_c1_seq1/m.6298 comp11719_c1_seq1/g.6298  ORF comp11719_c1_seq1/g.6298 comp11719_c1_seq1/m.6298 type:complete len:370 (-) comp11719_c1_seq1:443-1552(-)
MAALTQKQTVAANSLRTCVRAFSTSSPRLSQVWQDYPRDGMVGTVGKTPLIRLKSISDAIGRNVLAKAEFLNAGGSVKDRAALFLIKDAEERGLLKPGGVVVEGTAGNTGIGLAHICRAKGYQCVIYMPNTQSQEKIDILRTLGADVRPVPAVAFENPQNYNHQAKRYAESISNAVWTNQFDNTANRRAHYETTGPEIWLQTGGKIDAFTCATGTGGTFAGTTQYLKEQNPSVKAVLADPDGSVLYCYFKTGKMERAGGSITEGIGQGRVTDNLNGAKVDDAVRIPDTKAVEMTFRLLHEEGLFVGASSGLNVSAAVEVAKTLPEGSTVVTILCDLGQRYYARLFSKKWLESKALLTSVPEAYRHTLNA